MTRRIRTVALLLLSAACYEEKAVLDPSFTPSLDAQLRQQLERWGTARIGDVPAQNPAMVALGRALFFDKVLSGNRDVACATCHEPGERLTDGLSLAVGTGGSGRGPGRVTGPGRAFVPRSSATLLNVGLGFNYVFWDGRLEDGFGPLPPQQQPQIAFPPGLSGLLAKQAMLPVLNRAEMRGERGDLDVFGQPNELAAFGDSAETATWAAVMKRLLAIPGYQTLFASAFPGTPASTLGFQHAANAIAAFAIAEFTKKNSPFDRYLARHDAAMSAEAKRGGLLFFGEARCSQCHSGPLLGGQQFANIGVPQLGPGTGASRPLDRGRGELFPNIEQYQFAFRVAPLRNVELTAPYMHNGAYPTLEAVLSHYANADSAFRNYDVVKHAPALQASHRRDAATITAVALRLDFRVRQRIQLSDAQRGQLLAFLESLTDPAARTLEGLVPAAVPSGLPVR